MDHTLANSCLTITASSPSLFPVFLCREGEGDESALLV